MAIAFRAATSAGNATGANITGNKPTGVVDGDILIAWLYTEGVSVTPPSGWTLLATVSRSTLFDCRLYWKRASSEPASWTWSFSSTWRILAIAAYSGCVTSGDPTEALATAQNQTVNNYHAVSTTTVTNDAMVIQTAANYNSSTVSGGTSPVTNEAADLGGCAIYYGIKATAGATGTLTIGIDGGGTMDWATALFALKPDTGGGSVTVTDIAQFAAVVVDPSVVLGSITATDQAQIAAVVIDPAVTLGNLALTDQAAAAAVVVDPTVALGNITATDQAQLAAVVADPAVLAGDLTLTDTATTVAVTADPTVTLGSLTLTDQAALAAMVVDPTVAGGGAGVPGTVTFAESPPTSVMVAMDMPATATLVATMPASVASIDANPTSVTPAASLLHTVTLATI